VPEGIHETLWSRAKNYRISGGKECSITRRHNYSTDKIALDISVPLCHLVRKTFSGFQIQKYTCWFAFEVFIPNSNLPGCASLASDMSVEVVFCH